jgi:iron-sulfur cluster assembly protein
LSEFPVTLTDAAVAQAKRVLAKEGKDGSFLRIGVKGGGCSGLEYVMKADTAERDGDLRTQFGDLTVVCDPKSATYLEGATLDYTGNLIGGGFQFRNPNADRSCGCGTSFMPKARTS